MLTSVRKFFIEGSKSILYPRFVHVKMWSFFPKHSSFNNNKKKSNQNKTTTKKDNKLIAEGQILTIANVNRMPHIQDLAKRLVERKLSFNEVNSKLPARLNSQEFVLNI